MERPQWSPYLRDGAAGCSRRLRAGRQGLRLTQGCRHRQGRYGDNPQYQIPVLVDSAVWFKGQSVEITGRNNSVVVGTSTLIDSFNSAGAPAGHTFAILTTPVGCTASAAFGTAGALGADITAAATGQITLTAARPGNWPRRRRLRPNRHGGHSVQYKWVQRHSIQYCRA